MIIDCHTHVGMFNGKKWTPKELLASMDEAGITYSFLLADYHSGRGVPVEEAIEISRKYPRIKPVGNVTYRTFDWKQIDALKGHIKERRIIGVKFYPGYEPFYPFNTKLYPIYEFCAAEGVPVMFHSGMLESSFRGLLKHSHPLKIDELAVNFPDLKIVIAHMGNPWLTDSAAVVAKNENVYMDCSGYFAEYQPIDLKELKYFRRRMDEYRLFVGDYKKVLFGTDWPIYSQKAYLAAVRTLHRTSEEEDLMLYKNAQTLFNL